jgi:hypothetical protein
MWFLPGTLSIPKTTRASDADSRAHPLRPSLRKLPRYFFGLHNAFLIGGSCGLSISSVIVCVAASEAIRRRPISGTKSQQFHPWFYAIVCAIIVAQEADDNGVAQLDRAPRGQGLCKRDNCTVPARRARVQVPPPFPTQEEASIEQES